MTQASFVGRLPRRPARHAAGVAARLAARDLRERAPAPLPHRAAAAARAAAGGRLPLAADLPFEQAHALAEALAALRPSSRRPSPPPRSPGSSCDEIADEVGAIVASIQMLLFPARRSPPHSTHLVVAPRKNGVFLPVPGWLASRPGSSPRLAAPPAPPARQRSLSSGRASLSRGSCHGRTSTRRPRLRRRVLTLHTLVFDASLENESQWGCDSLRARRSLRECSTPVVPASDSCRARLQPGARVESPPDAARGRRRRRPCSPSAAGVPPSPAAREPSPTPRGSRPPTSAPTQAAPPRRASLRPPGPSRRRASPHRRAPSPPPARRPRRGSALPAPAPPETPRTSAAPPRCRPLPDADAFPVPDPVPAPGAAGAAGAGAPPLPVEVPPLPTLPPAP